MRELTLHEKITLKGLLAFKGVRSKHLIKLDMQGASFIFKRLYGRSILQYSKFLNHRKIK